MKFYHENGGNTATVWSMCIFLHTTSRLKHSIQTVEYNVTVQYIYIEWPIKRRQSIFDDTVPNITELNTFCIALTKENF